MNLANELNDLIKIQSLKDTIEMIVNVRIAYLLVILSKHILDEYY